MRVHVLERTAVLELLHHITSAFEEFDKASLADQMPGADDDEIAAV